MNFCGICKKKNTYVCGGFEILLNDELEMEHEKLCMLVFIGMRLLDMYIAYVELAFHFRFKVVKMQLSFHEILLNFNSTFRMLKYYNLFKKNMTT